MNSLSTRKYETINLELVKRLFKSIFSNIQKISTKKKRETEK